MLNTAPGDVPGRVAQLLDERRKLERELSEARRALATGGGAGTASAERQVSGIRFSPRLLEGVPARELKSLADDLKKQLGSGRRRSRCDQRRQGLGGGRRNRRTSPPGSTPSIWSRSVRPSWAAPGGGGRADMAQAGGPDPSRAEAALQAIERALSMLPAA